jgi:class 3 adenylate cyclase/pimeloyl-ACP methyl ester carboxylesterase
MAEPAGQRQLLAILFTDVVGYTALTERDEAAAVRVRDRHRERVREQVAAHGGELVDAPGDETLSVFASALAAVDCALALQAALRDDPELRLRIGIHLGDVLRRGGEVIGEGVNVAARIRPLAEPGGIAISEPVWQMVRSRSHLRAAPRGSVALKNVGAPVAVYGLSAAANALASRPRLARGQRIALGLAAGLALLAAVALPNRAAILASAALELPRWIGDPVEQQIGFATTSDGVRIAYATSGAGPPLVLVLGWATHLTEGLGSPLYDQAGALAWHSRDHLVVRFDGRGFGLSDRNVSDFSLDARVRDIEAVVDALGLERFDLSGLSAGTPTVVAYAARHPERVSRLVLACGGAGPGGGSRSPSMTPALADAWASAMRTSWESPVTRAMLIEFIAPEANEVERRILMHFFTVAGEGTAYADFNEAFRKTDASEQARSLRVPTLVVAGSLDKAAGVDGPRRIASLIPGARFEVIEGAGHIEACGNDPRAMRLVSDFLAEPTSERP